MSAGAWGSASPAGEGLRPPGSPSAQLCPCAWAKSPAGAARSPRALPACPHPCGPCQLLVTGSSGLLAHLTWGVTGPPESPRTLGDEPETALEGLSGSVESSARSGAEGGGYSGQARVGGGGVAPQHPASPFLPPSPSGCCAWTPAAPPGHTASTPRGRACPSLLTSTVSSRPSSGRDHQAALRRHPGPRQCHRAGRGHHPLALCHGRGLLRLPARGVSALHGGQRALPA